MINRFFGRGRWLFLFAAAIAVVHYTVAVVADESVFLLSRALAVAVDFWG